MRRQSLVEGALILTIASFITRILVFSNSIVLSRILGPEGIGLKRMVMPFVGLMMTLTTIGLPVAISRLVAQANAQRDRKKVKKILAVSLVITGSLSIVVILLSLFASKIFLRNLLPDSRAYYSFIALIPIIPIGAVSSVLKGYFRGMQNMNPIAISQVIEQIAQVSFTYILVQWLIPLGIEYAAAGAVLSSVIGETISLLIFVVLFKVEHKRKLRIPQPRWNYVLKGKTVLLELLQTSLPMTGNGFIMSTSRALQPIVITKSLFIAGVSSALITKEYGMLTGFVMPLLFLPGFINQSLGVTLVPAISEAHAQNNLPLVHHRINQAISAALIVGAPSTVLMYLFAPELMTLIYHAPAAAPLLKLITPFFLCNYIQTPLQSALIGIGKAKISMYNNIIAKCASIGLIYPLAANLKLGIQGVVLAISIGFILETALHFSSVVKCIRFQLHTITILKIILSGIIMGFCSRAILHMAMNSSSDLNSVLFILTILASLIIYITILGLWGIIHRHDFDKIPGISKILTLLFPK